MRRLGHGRWRWSPFRGLTRNLESIARSVERIPGAIGRRRFAASATPIKRLFIAPPLDDRVLTNRTSRCPCPDRCARRSAARQSHRLRWPDPSRALQPGLHRRRIVPPGDDLLEAGVLLKRFGDLARERVVANMTTLTDPSQKQQLSLILNRLDGLLPTLGMPASGAAQ